MLSKNKGFVTSLEYISIHFTNFSVLSEAMN